METIIISMNIEHSNIKRFINSNDAHLVQAYMYKDPVGVLILIHILK